MATLDYTAGGPAANSYVSDEEFVAWLADRPNAPVIADSVERARILIAAARDLQDLVEWDPAKVGCPTTTTQALYFPALYVLKRSRIAYYDVHEIPDFVKLGQMEQALAYYQNDPQANATDAIESIRVDVIDVKFVPESAAVPGQVITDATARTIGWWTWILLDGGNRDGSRPIVLV